MTDAPAHPIVAFKRQMTTLIEAKELPLPSNVSPEAFKNAAIVAVQDNPQILNCDRDSVFRSIRSLAAAGLVPDGREAALVPFKTKQGNDYISKCQAMPMVAGLIKMVRRSGEVADIRAHIVYANEVERGQFHYIVGDDERLEHEPILFGERGDPVACYAIAKLKDGTIIREFMSAEDIDHVRRSGASQRIFAKGEKPKVSDAPIGIWADWWSEMWKKTLIRRICKRLDMSAEDMRRVMVEQDFDHMRDVTPEPKPKTRMQEVVERARQEVLPPEEPEDDSHWTDDHDVVDAFPGSDEFEQGVKAFQSGKALRDIPYDQGTAEANDWIGGYCEARRSEE